MQTDAGGRRTLFLFALASLAAIAAGAATLAVADLGSWLRNPAAWGVGALLGGALYAGGQAAWVRTAALVLAPVGLVATLMAEPVDGVHRWVDAGPLHVNVAALLLPALIAAAGLAGVTTRPALAAMAASATLLGLQPDASQATALAAAAAVLLARSAAPAAVRAGLAAAFAAAAAVAWLRPDPLRPVAEVEEIFGLAFASAPVLAGLGALALAAAAAAPLGLVRRGRNGDAALALFVYFAITALAPMAGAYPVPLVGLGMSFPVGWWLGVALLCVGIGKEDAARG